MSSVPPEHPKRVQHFHEPGDFHELTFSTYRRLPLLTNDVWQRWLAEAITQACETQRCSLVAFVFMPEHVHLLILPIRPDRGTISRFLAAVKRPVSRQVKQSLIDTGGPLLQRLTVRERPGKTVLRFWQEGSGYDRNLHCTATVLSLIDDIHENPVRRG